MGSKFFERSTLTKSTVKIQENYKLCLESLQMLMALRNFFGTKLKTKTVNFDKVSIYFPDMRATRITYFPVNRVKHHKIQYC